MRATWPVHLIILKLIAFSVLSELQIVNVLIM
jgi:hypothetical protein